MKLIRTLILPLCFLLASCGPPQPEFQTRYELVQPPTKSGKYCANNCLSTQQICYQGCMQQQQSCEQNEMLRSQLNYSYNAYGYNRGYPNSYIYNNYTPRSCGVNTCNTMCDISFNMCYENCGGKVITHTNCVANCDQPPIE